MLKKFVSIKNIGTFRNHKPSGDIEHKKLTLIHAENGRGKTTLCAILRSLRLDDSNRIYERKTLDSVQAPHVNLLFDSGTVEFEDGNWGGKCRHIEIFDGDFITENVYSGDVISHDHKRNLCRVVLGAEGVKLADRLDGLVTEEKAAGTTLSSAKADVDRLVPRGMTLEAFLALKHDPQIEEKIAEQRKELNAQEASETIIKRPSLAPLKLERLADNLAEVLGKTVEGISADAAERVRAHIGLHLKDGTQDRRFSPEGWLSDGIDQRIGDACPMCAQPLRESPIIDAMRDYFSEAYRDFQHYLIGFAHVVRQRIGSQDLIDVQRVAAANVGNAEFWARYLRDVPELPVFEQDIQPVFNVMQATVEPLIARKLANPLEAVILPPEAKAALEAFRALRARIDESNVAIEKFNAAIEGMKRRMANVSTAMVKAQLAAFDAQKLRHRPETLTVVTAYEDAKTAKTVLEQAKDKAREDLDEYNEKVIGAYHDTVNDLLNRFGAGFRLKTVKVEYTGRTPRAAYSFEIRGKEVELGNEKTTAGTPSFRNTLSAGDKSTLALAFFIAQVRGRADIGDLIVVFDDPFTSLDSFRQTWTCTSIRKILESAKQVIVLSHSLSFLRLMAERCEAGKLKTLQIAKHGRADSHIIELDLNDATASQVEKDVIQLRGYHTGDHNDMPATIRCIRPVLENFIRKTAPNDCPPGDGWLGKFLAAIHGCDDASPLAVLKPMYDDLDNLNTYTSPFAHDSGACPAINSSELGSQVELTLKVIGRA